MNKDMHSIYETYKGTAANKEIIEEGLFDRLKARGAQAVGAVKGLGNQAAGIAKGAVAGVKGDTAGVQAAQQQRQAGAAQGQLAKINSYKATAMKKLDATSNEIFNDLKALGIDLSKVSQKSIGSFKGQLNKAFDALTASIQNPASGEEDCEWSTGEEDCDEMVDGVKTRVGLEPQVKPTKFFK